VPAFVIRRHNDNCIDVHIFNGDPGGIVRTSVVYDGEGPEEDPDAYVSWRWMPYQVETANKGKFIVAQQEGA
jgi:hypothetical protein